MASDTVISIRDVSKLYRLGEVSTGVLVHDLNRWWHKVRGKEDPYTRIGSTNDRTKAAESEYVWALKDVNLDVSRGEVLGIIGRNGAGKSTLLKILSRVTKPTNGYIGVKGRIASLLEVGTGFHPELTGRENIFLNGAILGMRRSEISQQLDAIVSFSGCERYLDTPVKRYSSGMYVRLAFAVSAHLNSETLVVDEVLAVGDQAFQDRCIGKMSEVANSGRTVLFVSHNMASIKRLCTKACLLNMGTVEATGTPQEIVHRYFRSTNDVTSEAFFDWEPKSAPGDSSARFSHVHVYQLGRPKHASSELPSSADIAVELGFNCTATHERLLAGFELLTEDGTSIFTSHQLDAPDAQQLRPRLGMNRWICTIPSGLLNSGHYVVAPFLAEHNQRWICKVDLSARFTVLSTHGDSALWREFETRNIRRNGAVAPVLPWEQVSE